MYPLAEKEVVVGFEAAVAGRVVNVQIQSRGKLEDCCLDCCPTAALDTQCTNGKDWCCCGNSSQDMQCTNGEGINRDRQNTVRSHIHIVYTHINKTTNSSETYRDETDSEK